MATPLKLAGAALPGNEYALPPGTRVGGVVIDSVLSVGEYGIVYHAVDPMLRRAVALKEYFAPAFCVRDAEGQVAPRTPGDAAAFSTGRQAFVEEARLLAHLDIPGLLGVTGLFEDHGTVFRVMPHAPGRTLASWRAMYSDTMDEGGLRHLLSDLMVPLEALHAANLVHGYVLPEQVILAEGRPALLLGFGTVRRSLQGALDPAYTPVEQLPSGGHLPRGAWSDVYALAALARFAMSAQPVAVSADPPTAHALRTRAPMGHALSHALERALAPSPGDRPQSIGALRQAMGLRPSGPLGSGTVDVTLPGGEAFDSTATRPWPQPSIGAALRASSPRSAVAEQTATAAALRMTPARPAAAPALPTPVPGAAMPGAMAALPLPVRPSSHDEAAHASEPSAPAVRAWADRPADEAVGRPVFPGAATEASAASASASAPGASAASASAAAPGASAAPASASAPGASSALASTAAPAGAAAFAPAPATASSALAARLAERSAAPVAEPAGEPSAGSGAGPFAAPAVAQVSAQAPDPSPGPTSAPAAAPAAAAAAPAAAAQPAPVAMQATTPLEFEAPAFPPVVHDPTPGEPALEANSPLFSALTAGPREPSFGPIPGDLPAPGAPEHDPIPQFMASAAAHDLQEPQFHPPTFDMPPVTAPRDDAGAAARVTAPAAPLTSDPPQAADRAPALPTLDFQPIELPPGWVPRERPSQPASQARPQPQPQQAAASSSGEEEPIDDAVRAAIAAAIGSLPPAPPRRALSPHGAESGDALAPAAQRIDLPDFSHLQVAPPPPQEDEAPPAARHAGGLSPRARIAAVVVAVLVLIAIGAVAWSAWKDATLNLGGLGSGG